MYIYYIAQNSDSCSMTSAVHAMLMCSFLYHEDDDVVDELHYEIKKIEGRQPAWEDDADDEERYIVPMNCVAPLLLNTDMPASNQDMILTVIIINIIIIIIIIMKIIISSGHLLSMTEFLTDHNERFQKISILYHGRLLGFPKGRGGSQLWNSKGMGVFTIGNPKAWGNSAGGISLVESVE